MVQTFLKMIWWRFFVPRSERLLISSATLSSETWNISASSVLVYCYTNNFFLRSFSLMHWSVQFINQGFKCFEHNFFILKFHSFMLFLNFITSKYSFFGRIIQVWYQYLYPSSWSVSSQIFPPFLWLCLLRLYWGLWPIYSSSFWKVFSFLLSFFSISNDNILYFFP